MQDIATDERPIVVGVDGSAGAQHALHWASGEALVRGVALEVVHAWEPPYSISGVGSILSPRELAPYGDRARKVLEQAIDEERGAVETSPSIIPKLRQGYPPSKLAEATHDAQLLVVGSRGVGGLKGALLGSVSHHCTMHSTVPVAVVRENAGWSHTDEIVVGIDGSDEAAAALRWAIREAVVRNSKLVVIHAWHFDAKTAPAEHRYAAREQADRHRAKRGPCRARGRERDRRGGRSTGPSCFGLVVSGARTSARRSGGRDRVARDGQPWPRWFRRLGAGLREPALPPPGARCGRRRSPRSRRPRVDGSGTHRLSAPRRLKRDQGPGGHDCE